VINCVSFLLPFYIDDALVVVPNWGKKYFSFTRFDVICMQSIETLEPKPSLELMGLIKLKTTNPRN
jgi:hypothetical protein